MASKKITAMPNLAGAQVPTDLATLVDLSAVPASQNVKSTLNDLFAEITKNITDLSVQFGNGAAASVSAASKGKIRYNATAQAFQVSENAGAYASLLKGAGAAGQVGYFAGAATLAGSNNLFYDSVNVRLGVGVGTSPAAPLHVETDISSLAVRVTDTATTLNADFSASGGVAFFGTTTTHPLELWTDGTTRVRIETSGVVGINTTTPGAQLNVVSGAAGTIGLLVAGASGATADLFRVDLVASDRLRFTAASELILGKASTATATLTLAQAGGTTTTGLRAGNAANSLIYVFPLADPTASQVLTAAAPVAGVVQLSWATGGGGGTITGSGAAGQVTFWSGASAITGSNNFFYDPAAVRLGIGVGTSPAAPVHVETDVSSLAVRVTDTATALNADFSASGGVAFLGTTTTHPLEMWTAGTTRVRIETSGVVGINNAAPGAQLDVVSGAAGTVGLIVSSAASPAVNIVTVRQNATAVFQITSVGAIVHQSVNLTTGDGAAFSSSTVSSGNVVSIAATGTAAASNSKHALVVSTSGANAASGQTTFGAEISNSSTGATSTNIALRLSASGATTNTALDIAAGAFTTVGTITQTSASAAAFESGPNGSTNPVFRLVNNVASAATGLSITGNAAGSGVTLTALSSGTNEAIKMSPKGTANFTTTAEQFVLDVDSTGVSNFSRILHRSIFIVGGNVTGTNVATRLMLDGGSGANAPMIRAQAAGSHILVFGPLDAASPSAQTLSVQNVVAGTTNTAGVDWTRNGSIGTGTGAGGRHIWRVAGAGSSGTAQNSLVTALQLTPAASAATGLDITSNAAGSGVTLTALSSGTNEGITYNVKGAATHTFVWDTGSSNNNWQITSIGSLTGNSNLGGLKFQLVVASSVPSLRLASDTGVQWNSTNTLSSGAIDTSIIRHAAGTVRITTVSGGISTGAGSLLIAPSSVTAAAQLHVATSNAATAAITNQAVLEALSTGTPAAGFGPGLQFNGQSSTTAAQNMARVAAVWTNATHAFRTAALTFSLVNLAAAQTEYGRWTPDTLVVHAGTNPTVYTSGSAIVKLYIIDDVTPPMAVNAFFTATAGSCARFQTLRGRGSNASPAAVQNGDALGAYEFVGMYSTTANSFAVGARIVAAATETWSLTANGTDLQFHVANNGGTIVERMTLTRTGTLRINPNGAYSGFTTNTLLQVGNYASWNNATIAGIFAQSSSNRVLDLVGTLGQTADIIKAFNDTASVDLFNLTAAGIVASVAGASTSQVRHGGVLRVNTTAASNTGTGATDLISYSLPASTLGTNNDFIEIEAWGTYAANANNKTVTLQFGATTIYTTGAVAQNGGAWSIKARVIRTGATTQDAIATIIASGSVGDDATFTTPAETLSSAVTIKCTATGGASSDITQEGLIVKWYPAN